MRNAEGVYVGTKFGKQAVTLQLANGTTVGLKVPMALINGHRLKKGETVVTFRYQELSEKGVPRFPTFVGIRADMDAAQVLAGEGKQGRAPWGPFLRDTCKEVYT
ncbi:hypothetical protein DFJ74DRAFT_710071 [Hyaloraphidium curvatum]|nr:hypothetical protein DFJ74DRAFT_710071 [Hyaloraphidium curvatum]